MPLIISPADEAPVSGVPSGLDGLGRGSAEPIDGHKVVLTVEDLPTTSQDTISSPARSSSK